jgi:putative ABC transport system permease protein
LPTLLQNLRYATRHLSKSPGFSIVAVLTLALGIGANTAIYSVIHGALKLPYRNADRMMAFKMIYPQGTYFGASWSDFLEWRSRSKSFTQIAGLFIDRMTWRGISESETLNIGLITEGYFRMYDMQPLLGRSFLPSDHERGARPVCALGEDFWREELKSDPSTVNKPLNLDGKTCTIIGVMPKVIPDSNHPAQVWMPMEPMPAESLYSVGAVGLLHPGVSQAQALAEVRGIKAQLDKQLPRNAYGVDLQPLAQVVFGDLRSIMHILFGAVGLILLMACVNLANLLLSRAVDRAREFAVRRAVGASARHMIQQTLTESLLLSTAGALVGLFFAFLLIHVPISAWPKGFTPPSDVHLDGTVLIFTALLTTTTGLLFSIVPLLRVLRRDGNATLQQGPTSTETREQNRTRSILVVAEIALSMVLITGALNMALYLMRLMRVDPGVNPKDVLSISVALPPNRYPDAASQWRFYSNLLNRLAVLPGVNSTVGGDTPFWGSFPVGDFSYEGESNTTAKNRPFAGFHFITPGYFATVQAQVLQGRDFTMHDRAGSQKVAIINQGMAGKLWPGQSAIGKSIHCCSKDGDYVVIGIVNDIRFSGPAQLAGYEIYLSVEQNTPPALSFLLRTPGDPVALAEPVRRVVAAVDPGVAVSHIATVEDLADQTIAGPRTSTVITVILGIFALLLASIGIYGVMAYSVSRRERELGIRIAFGADRFHILTLLFSGAMRLTSAGILIGAGSSWVLHRWMGAILDATELNEAALVIAMLLLVIVTVMATLIPSRKASLIEPMRALRNE